MNIESVVEWTEMLIVDHVDQEVIVFNEETQKTHILNETAGYLFIHLRNQKIGNVIEEFYNALSDDDKSYYIKDDIVQDCLNIIEEMIAQGLLKIS